MVGFINENRSQREVTEVQTGMQANQFEMEQESLNVTNIVQPDDIDEEKLQPSLIEALAHNKSVVGQDTS